MITFPPCKINIGLWVTHRRTDGYHDIETIMIPAPWNDVLEILPATDYKTTLKVTGLLIEEETEKNLCYKAWELLHTKHHIPHVQMHLHKCIPFGAGLGGGSADAAYTLKALNTLFNLQLDNTILKNYAVQLGMDCAFFIDEKPALATGRGDILKETDIDLRDYYIMIVKPDCHINTALAYKNIIPRKRAYALAHLIKKDIAEWKNTIDNDFEKYAFSVCTEIEDIKNKLYAQGALYASMSGSGSAVFGIFKNTPLAIAFEKATVFISELQAV